MTAHYVYRAFDQDNRLVYVGCSKNLFDRLIHHRNNSWWSPQVSRVTARVYPDKLSGRRAEQEAIATEMPRWNVQGRWATRHTWSPSDYADYERAYVNAYRMTPARERHLSSIRRAAVALDVPQIAIRRPVRGEEVA